MGNFTGRRYIGSFADPTWRCGTSSSRSSAFSLGTQHRSAAMSVAATRLFSGVRSFASSGQQAGKTNAKQASNKPTHYDILNIQPPSNPKEIKQAYLRRAKDCHPDIHGESRTAEFQRLTAAYTVLSDEGKKADYDAFGYRDYEDLTDGEKATYAFRQKTKEWRQMPRGQAAWMVFNLYIKVYIVLYIALFVLTLPLYFLWYALKLVTYPFRLLIGA